MRNEAGFAGQLLSMEIGYPSMTRHWKWSWFPGACGKIEAIERDPHLQPVVDLDTGEIFEVIDKRTGRKAEELGPPISETEAYRRMVAFLHATADSDHTHNFAYFIGGDQGAIKIGVSRSVEARLKALQSGSPVILRIMAVAPGGVARESAYHYQFAAHRLHGEWFERHPDILAEIERLNE